MRGVQFESSAGAATLAAFLETSFADGFLVLHDGRIVSECYYHGMAAARRCVRRRCTRAGLMRAGRSYAGWDVMRAGEWSHW